MRLLVTGSAGFIGSAYVLKRLLEHSEDEIVSLDKLTYAGALENLAPAIDNERHTFIRGDITDDTLLEKLFTDNSFDAVINFAAESHVDRSITDPAEFMQTNAMGVFSLLEKVRRFDIERFIQISTDEVYGSLGPNDPAFTETTPLNPSSPYSASKAAADMLALSYHRTFGTPVIITRCSNNYGPNQFPEKLIPLFINNLRNDIPVPIYGEGENVRDWIHVNDHCHAINLVLKNGRTGEIYNIGASCELKNIDVADKLLEIMGKSASLKSFVKDRPGHDLRYAMDFTKIQDELGYRPTISFDEGLRSTVDWYEQNRKWLDSVTSGAYRDYYEKMYGER